ncbi:hypothetical protein PT974_12163 [Cladobotryum mycophilum]|uniref:Uncharacterized protein n=1 Tax=Cladobotryum mycophilum TaxID=491253 RepID=A0ABR0S781_9HYPO
MQFRLPSNFKTIRDINMPRGSLSYDQGIEKLTAFLASFTNGNPPDDITGSLDKVVKLFADDLSGYRGATKSRKKTRRTILSLVLQNIDSDMFFLCALALPESWLAKFIGSGQDADFVLALKSWWGSSTAPPSFSNTAAELCRKYNTLLEQGMEQQPITYGTDTWLTSGFARRFLVKRENVQTRQNSDGRSTARDTPAQSLSDTDAPARNEDIIMETFVLNQPSAESENTRPTLGKHKKDIRVHSLSHREGTISRTPLMEELEGPLGGPVYLIEPMDAINKDRLYVALYARGGAPKMPGLEDTYHWALIVGPKSESSGSHGSRFHAKESLGFVGNPPVAQSVWQYEERQISMAPTSMLLVRVLVAKVKNMSQLRSIFE